MIKHTQIICWLYFSLWNIFDGSSARTISLVELSIDSLSDKIPIYCKWHYEWHFQNKEHHIWVKVFKNGPSKICGRKPVKFWSDTVCLSRPYHFKFFKGCLPQILLGPFLTYITLEIVHYGSETIAWLGLKIWYADIWRKQKIQKILTSLNQILNSTNQRIVRAVCVNYIYNELSFIDVPFVYCIFLNDFIYAFVFLHQIFIISVYVFIQVQVVIVFLPIAHFKILIKSTKSYMDGPCKYWQFGE